MVTRYRFNYVQEMFETDTGEQHNETERGEWVKYEDYERLKEAVENYIDRMTHEFDSEYSLCSDPRIALAEILGRSLSDMQ